VSRLVAASALLSAVAKTVHVVTNEPFVPRVPRKEQLSALRRRDACFAAEAALSDSLLLSV
jgi:hypothetical protein